MTAISETAINMKKTEKSRTWTRHLKFNTSCHIYQPSTLTGQEYEANGYKN